jgi:hypothetical protein
LRVAELTRDDTPNGMRIARIFSRQCFLARAISKFLPDCRSSIIIDKITRPIQQFVAHILSLRTFGDVAGIETWRIVAGMPSARRRPMTMTNKKGEAVHLDALTPEAELTVTARFRKWPDKTLVGIVGLNRGCEISKKSVTLCSKHLGSSKAKVLRRIRCPNSGSPFIVPLSVLRNQDYSDCLVTEDGIGFTVGKL